MLRSVKVSLSPSKKSFIGRDWDAGRKRPQKFLRRAGHWFPSKRENQSAIQKIRNSNYVCGQTWGDRLLPVEFCWPPGTLPALFCLTISAVMYWGSAMGWFGIWPFFRQSCEAGEAGKAGGTWWRESELLLPLLTFFWGFFCCCCCCCCNCCAVLLKFDSRAQSSPRIASKSLSRLSSRLIKLYL